MRHRLATILHRMAHTLEPEPPATALPVLTAIHGPVIQPDETVLIEKGDAPAPRRYSTGTISASYGVSMRY